MTIKLYNTLTNQKEEFILSTHYRQPLDYGTSLIEEAKKSLEKIKNAYKNLIFALENNQFEKQPYSALEIDGVVEYFEKNMNDDLNTPNALGSLHQIVNIINDYLTNYEKLDEKYLNYILDKFKKMLFVLGFEFNFDNEINDEEIISLIEERKEAKKLKQFKKADEIRSVLLQKGIQIEDTRQGTRWHKIK